MDACINLAAALAGIEVDLTYLDKFYKGSGEFGQLLDEYGYCLSPADREAREAQPALNKKNRLAAQAQRALVRRPEVSTGSASRVVSALRTQQEFEERKRREEEQTELRKEQAISLPKRQRQLDNRDKRRNTSA